MPGGKQRQPKQRLHRRLLPCPTTSDKTYLTVQEEPIPTLPDQPSTNKLLDTPHQSRQLPLVHNKRQLARTWRPLIRSNGQIQRHRNYNPYSNAPLAPHIMWTKPVAFGGLMGGYGEDDTSNFYSTSNTNQNGHPSS